MSFLTTNIKFKDSNLIDIKAEETFVGWYLGKKLYRKVITSPIDITASSPANIEHGIENFDSAIFHSEILLGKDLQLPYIDGNATIAVKNITSTKIQFVANDASLANNTVQIVLYYTKTK